MKTEQATGRKRVGEERVKPCEQLQKLCDAIEIPPDWAKLLVTAVGNQG